MSEKVERVVYDPEAGGFANQRVDSGTKEVEETRPFSSSVLSPDSLAAQFLNGAQPRGAAPQKVGRTHGGSEPPPPPPPVIMGSGSGVQGAGYTNPTSLKENVGTPNERPIYVFNDGTAQTSSISGGFAAAAFSSVPASPAPSASCSAAASGAPAAHAPSYTAP